MKAIVIALAAAFVAATPASAANPVTGRWLTAEKDAVILIAPCGSQMCGTIDRFIVPPPQGLDQRDVNNRDPGKRSRKLLGMAILTGFTPDGSVWNGTIYDPKSGKTYRSVLERDGGKLKVKGCISIFCQTQTWSPAK